MHAVRRAVVVTTVVLLLGLLVRPAGPAAGIAEVLAAGRSARATYRETLRLGPYRVTHAIVVEALAQGPRDIGRGGADFIHELRLSGMHTEAGCRILTRARPPLVLGGPGDPVRLTSVAEGGGTSTPDVMLHAEHQGRYLLDPFGGDHAEVAYGTGDALRRQRVLGRSSVIAVMPPGQWATEFRHAFTGSRLAAPDQYYLVSLDVAWHHGEPGQRLLRARWEVPVYAVGPRRTPVYRTTLRLETEFPYRSGSWGE